MAFLIHIYVFFRNESGENRISPLICFPIFLNLIGPSLGAFPVCFRLSSVTANTTLSHGMRMPSWPTCCSPFAPLYLTVTVHDFQKLYPTLTLTLPLTLPLTDHPRKLQPTDKRDARTAMLRSRCQDMLQPGERVGLLNTILGFSGSTPMLTLLLQSPELAHICEAGTWQW